MTDALVYALASLRRASENGYSWSVSPAEAAAIVAEVERLRAEADLLRTSRDATREYADRVEAERLSLRAQVAELQALGVSLHKAGDDGYRAGYRDGQQDEREAVVEWLRELAVAALSEPRLVPFERLLSDMADVIERGEHRAKVKP